MGFWAAIAAVIVSAAAVIVLLYALALWVSVRDESYFQTLCDLTKQLFSGDFW